MERGLFYVLYVLLYSPFRVPPAIGKDQQYYLNIFAVCVRLTWRELCKGMFLAA